MRWLRGIVAIAMLSVVTASYWGVKYCAVAVKTQPAFTPVFGVVLLLTLLWGRFFCGAMCPLGVLQSLVNRIFHPKTHVRRVCTRLPATKTQNAVRLAVLAVFAALVALGATGLASAALPISIFGRFLAAVHLQSAEGTPVALGFRIASIAAFAAILVSAVFAKGRLWCNWVCPAGTLFTLLSRFSLAKDKVGKGCGNCKRCFADCPARAEAEKKEGSAA